MNKLSPFEEGYAAFLAGRNTNPYSDNDGKTPYSEKRWEAGWKKAKADRRVQ